MVTDLKVFFYARKNYVNKDGKVAILVRLVLNGQKTQFSSKQTIAINLWNESENRVKGKSANAKVINKALDEIEANLKFHYKELRRYESLVTVHQVRDAYLGVAVTVHMLLDEFEQHNMELFKRLGKDISSCTFSKYKRTKERLANFIQEKFNRIDIPIQKVNINLK